MAHQIVQLFEDYFQWRLSTSPEYATLAGVHGDNGSLLDSFSLESYEKCKIFYKELLVKVEEIEKNKVLMMDIQNNESLKISFLVFKVEIENYLEGTQFKPYLRPINNLEGPQSNFPLLVSYMPFKTMVDYENYLKRLQAFPTQIDQIIELLNQGIKENHTSSKTSVIGVPAQLSNLSSIPLERSTFYKPFKTFPASVEPSQQQLLASRGGELITSILYPAYKKLANYLEETYLPHCKDQIAASSIYPDGENYYKVLLKYHTSTDLTPLQIFQIGMEEVKRIKPRMEAIIAKIGFKGTFADFVKHLRSDKTFYYKSGEELVDSYRCLLKKIEPKLVKIIGTLPRTPCGVKKLSETIAPTSPSAYYLGPSGTGDRPGVFYVNTYKTEERPKYEMVALTCHEALPGHHLQIALASEMSSIPKWRRNLEDRNYYQAPARTSLNTAYMEGWGLYAEYLGEELKLYKDDYSLFGRLSMEIWRACRLVVDTGMHALGWSKEQAILFLSENTALSLHNIESEVNRYITWPGQACAYKIGELKLKELRQYAERELGSLFDVRKFHDKILSTAPVPLTILKEEVELFVQQHKLHKL